jgi:hypothetical protein
MALLSAIPRDSAYVRKTLGDQAAEWDYPTELQASAVDLLQVISRTLLGAYAKNPPTDAIEPVRRPFDAPKSKPQAQSLNALADFLKG